jgi:NADPH-dependent glutamate synthase beta subunit-like oxidoreductase
MAMAQAEAHGVSFEAACESAFYLLADLNPLPASCARVCPHQCEARCNRAHVDTPVAINALERYLGDFALERKLPLQRSGEERVPERIAVVGSGPGGLSCAYQLARRGYAVTVFEGFPQPGGMLRYGTPAFRLAREVLDAEIDRLRSLGIDIRCGAPVPSIEELRRDHAAVFVGIRATAEPRPGFAAPEVPNVISAVDFLRRVNAAEPFDPGPAVVVIGGGDTAMDAARTAVRLGAGTTVIAPRTAADLPCAPGVAADAQAEGVRIEGPARVVALPVEDGKATAATAIRLAGDGAVPEAVAGSEFVVPASTIIVAGKPERDTRGLGALAGPEGALKTTEHGETALPGVFAAADDLDLGIVSTAIFRGRRAAEIIHARLRGLLVPAVEAESVIGKEGMHLGYYPRAARVEERTTPPAARLAAPWSEVAAAITATEAGAEAARCLSCGQCFACDTCWKYCQEQAIVRPPEKGQPYRIKLEFCTGCRKCADECPCGYIEMR